MLGREEEEEEEKVTMRYTFVVQMQMHACRNIFPRVGEKNEACS